MSFHKPQQRDSHHHHHIPTARANGNGSINSGNGNGSVSNPVRSSKGGYLRSPFEISTDFSEQAARFVLGGAGTKAFRRAEGEPESAGAAGEKSRKWLRAGVGADRMTQRERQLQMEQSRLAYGDVVGPAGSAGDEASGEHNHHHQQRQAHVVGASMEERQMLKKIAGQPKHKHSRGEKRAREETVTDEPAKAHTAGPSEASTATLPSSAPASAPAGPVSKVKRFEQLRLAALYGKKGKKR